MKKRTLALLLAICMVAGLCACGSPASSSGAGSVPAAESDPVAGTPVEESGYKIAIMTTTVSQGEESYSCATRLANEDPDHIILATFPENIATEQETTISTALSLASDPDVKAIVFSQAVQGTAAACQKIREIRPDILLIGTMYADDTVSVSESMDVAYNIDVPQFGNALAEIAENYGCTDLIFYTFARHMAIQTHADRLVNLEKRCAELGINYHLGTTPDPMGDAGVSGTQQFVLEDVPRMVDQYGEMTGFSGSNPSQMEPMIKTVLETNSYFLMPSDPSPFLGFVSALGIEVPADRTYDADYVISAIKEELAARDMSGHMGTWTAPVMTMFMEAGVEYARAWCNGEIDKNERMDQALLTRVMSETGGGEVDCYPVEFNGVTYNNCMYVFGQYEVY